MSNSRLQRLLLLAVLGEGTPDLNPGTSQGVMGGAGLSIPKADLKASSKPDEYVHVRGTSQETGRYILDNYGTVQGG